LLIDYMQEGTGQNCLKPRIKHAWHALKSACIPATIEPWVISCVMWCERRVISLSACICCDSMLHFCAVSLTIPLLMLIRTKSSGFDFYRVSACIACRAQYCFSSSVRLSIQCWYCV